MDNVMDIDVTLGGFDYVVVVFNDPVNTECFLRFALGEVLGVDDPTVSALLADISSQGKAVVSAGGLEWCERVVTELLGLHVWAACEVPGLGL